jgi:hypothetical protein
VAWLAVGDKTHTNFKLNTMITDTHNVSINDQNPDCAKPLLGAVAVD